MSRHRYPLTRLYLDYLRVAFGLALTIGPLLLLDLATAVTWLLSGLALLFGWFGLRTGLRQLSWIELSPDAIAVHGPLARQLSWERLAGVKLAYYAPRGGRSSRRSAVERDDRNGGRSGWLQLTLRAAPGRPIRVESTLDGFDQVLRHALAAVARKQLVLDPTTLANLAALGLDRDAPAKPLLTPGPAGGLAARPGPKGSL
ncbi:MAG: hypothetical protein ACREH3_06990 [Geminicoccales bacterium]